MSRYKVIWGFGAAQYCISLAKARQIARRKIRRSPTIMNYKGEVVQRFVCVV